MWGAVLGNGRHFPRSRGGGLPAVADAGSPRSRLLSDGPRWEPGPPAASPVLLGIGARAGARLLPLTAAPAARQTEPLASGRTCHAAAGDR